MLRTTSSAEVSEWIALFEVEHDEQTKQARHGGAADATREPVIGDASQRRSVIDEARRREGLA